MTIDREPPPAAASKPLPAGASAAVRSRAGRAVTTPEPLRALDSAQLLGGAPRIAIRHGGDLYWLQATRQGKLLLTK